MKPSNSTIIATPECRQRIKSFTEGLRALCDEYHLDLAIDYYQIGIQDRQRPRNEDWPDVAALTQEEGRKELICQICTISQNDFPEEFATLVAARNKGETW